MEPLQYIDTVEQQLTPLHEDVMRWLQEPATYYQFMIFLGAIAAAYCIFLTIRRVLNNFRPFKRKPHTSSPKWLVYQSIHLIFPLLGMLFLIIGTQLSEKWTGNADFIDALTRVSVVWVLWAFVSAYVTNTLIRTVGLWILIPAALLRLFGWFDVVVTYLEEYGFSLGKIEITAYTFVKAIFFISIIIWVGKLLSNAGESYIRKKSNLTRPTKELLIKIFEVVLYSILFLATMNLIGIDLTALAVFSGAFGVGLGFGLQKIASNFISGIILLTEKSININNLIEMDDGVLGYVRKLGSRASVIETFDGKEVMVPNEDFITSRVANLTHTTNKGRIEIPVGVSYNTDLHLAHDLILEAATSYGPAVKDEEEFKPQVFLREFGESSVDFMLTFWLQDVTTGRWRAKSDVMFDIWDSFSKHNIQIPFPQHDLHLKSGFEKLTLAQDKKLNSEE